jgi:hypothetical protein
LKLIAMRIPALVMIATATIVAAAPAQSQP